MVPESGTIHATHKALTAYVPNACHTRHERTNCQESKHGHQCGLTLATALRSALLYSKARANVTPLFWSDLRLIRPLRLTISGNWDMGQNAPTETMTRRVIWGWVFFKCVS